MVTLPFLECGGIYTYKPFAPLTRIKNPFYGIFSLHPQEFYVESKLAPNLKRKEDEVRYLQRDFSNLPIPGERWCEWEEYICCMEKSEAEEIENAMKEAIQRVIDRYEPSTSLYHYLLFFRGDKLLKANHSFYLASGFSPGSFKEKECNYLLNEMVDRMPHSSRLVSSLSYLRENSKELPENVAENYKKIEETLRKYPSEKSKHC